MDGLWAGTQVMLQHGVQKPLAQAEDCKVTGPGWMAASRSRRLGVFAKYRRMGACAPDWERVLTVRSTKGLSCTPMTSHFYSESNHFTTLAQQRNQVEGNELTVTLPVADYAPEKLGKLVGLLFHPQGWPGTNGKKYMPVSLPLE